MIDFSLPELPQIGLEFADMGSVLTPDGREHQVSGSTPVMLTTTTAPATTAPVAAAALPGIGWPDWLTPDFMKEKHYGARFVIGIIAIGLILIAALRLTR